MEGLQCIVSCQMRRRGGRGAADSELNLKKGRGVGVLCGEGQWGRLQERNSNGESLGS